MGDEGFESGTAADEKGAEPEARSESRARRVVRYMRAIPGDFLRVFAAEAILLVRYRRFGIAIAAICFFPALYLLIYLGGVWDPVARTGALPVAIVDLDRGVDYRGRSVNVGEELTKTLLARDDLGFRVERSEAAARDKVASGALAFAVVVPSDFSANAVPGEKPGQGRVRILLSEGNNYSTSGIARRFAAELGHQVNETLNAERWKAVLRTAGDSAGDLKQLKSGIGQLRDGARQLNDGTHVYGDAATGLGNGFEKVSGAIHTMEAKLPADADLEKLTNGAMALAGGQRKLGSGLAQLHSGAGQLEAGLGEMQEKSKAIPFGGQRVSDGAAQLKAGAAKLGNGIASAQDGSRRLAYGADEVARGTARLTDGMSALGGGIRQLSAAMPSDDKLKQFVAGADRLEEGSDRLLVGIEKLDAAVPADIATIGGTAKGLASSVTPVLDNLAPVENNGMAFAPSMLSVAAWVGAVVVANMFSMRALRSDLATAPRSSKALGKYALPALVVLAQSLLLALCMRYGLGIVPADRLGFWVTSVLSALTFFAVVFALLRLVGDAGKLVAVLLLTLQLTAGGGILPAELTGGFYQSVHGWLPFTFAIQAFRASIFGAFGGDWETPATLLAWFLAGSLVFAIFLGRWKLVTPADYRPAIDI